VNRRSSGGAGVAAGPSARDHENPPRIRTPIWLHFCFLHRRMAKPPQLPERGQADERTNAGNGSMLDSSVPDVAVEAALVQTTPAFEDSGVLSGNPLIALLPVEVDIAVPIRGFRVRNLLALAEGQAIESQWLPGDDMPLSARGKQLAWAEFEVIDTKLAVRIARLV
jgi:flagellar motor switch protein FliN/FliY